MPTVRLHETWILGERIGGGGFGQVYEAASESNDSAVIKLVPKSPGASRELLFADLKGARNIVPILDSGEHEEYWALAMPRAQKSLRQLLDEAPESRMPLEDVVKIVTDITSALADISDQVVHRDLKPENVLLLDQNWCLADFGISRYAEVTTAPDTQKFALSPPYAAPERWRAETATHATDIYSLGVLAYELTTGSLPFTGPAIQDFRHQHLHEQQAPIRGIPALLDALIEECLYKSMGARPTAQNLLARLPRIAELSPPPGVKLLQEANRVQVSSLAEKEREQSARLSDTERRAELFKAAQRSFTRISDTLQETILQNAPAASKTQQGAWSIRLNNASITLGRVTATSVNPWENWDAPAFEVIAHTSILVRIPKNRSEYEGRSHSIWFCDARQEGQYEWLETAFMTSGSRGIAAR